MKTEKVLKILAVIIFIIYTISLAFDVGVSYHHYQKNPQYFLCFESNEHITAELEKGFDFFQTNTIGFMVLLVLIYPLLTYFFIEKIEEKEKNKFLKYIKIFCLGITMGIYIYLAYIHFIGGFSWIL